MNPLPKPQPHDVPLQTRIDSLYDEMRELVTSYAGKPGLREALRPLQEELHRLQGIEAEEISRRYDSQFQAKYDEAAQLIQGARHTLKS